MLQNKYLRWFAIGGGLFGLFLFFLYRSFPYEILVQRLTNNIQRRAKVRIKLDRVQPYWFSGLDATGVNIRQLAKKGTAEIQIDRATVHLSLLSLLFGSPKATFFTSIARGELSGDVQKKGSFIKVNLNVDGLQLAAIGPPPSAMRTDKTAQPLIKMLFAPVYGRLKAAVKMDIPLPGAKPKARPKPKAKKPKSKRNTRRRRRRTRRTRRRPRRVYRRSRGIDVKQLDGTIQLNIVGLTIGPGYFPTANLGEVPVPRLRLGNLLLKLKIANGKATIVKGVSIGTDGELHLYGSIQLRSRLNYSVFRGRVKFKINPALKNSPATPPLLKAALGMLGPGKNGGFHTYKIYLPFRGRPRFRKL